MANTIKVRQSSVAGKVPTTAQLALGELAINTTDGKLFLKKNVSGKESIVDVTSAASASVPAGAVMLFASASAPTGWTQTTTDIANNRMLRVVNTTGGGSGGSHSPILNNVVPSHTHGFTTGLQSADHGHSGSTGGVSADHAHATLHVTNYHPFGLSSIGGTSPGIIATNAYSEIQWESTSGANANHVHGFSTGGVSANHSHSGSTDNGSSQTNWTPRYVDLIMCTKN